MTSEIEPHTDPLLDLMDATEGHYTEHEYGEAAVSINKVWVKTYESVHVAHDMKPLTALLLLEKTANFPDVIHPEIWWAESFAGSLKAIASLCRERLDQV